MKKTYAPTRLKTFALSALAVFAFTWSALAEEKPVETIRVRGIVTNFDGTTLGVATREGEDIAIGLADGWMVSGVAAASVQDIDPGDYVGVASLAKADGGDGALEVLIFPAALKGVDEGTFAYDLRPDSTMTNATVAEAVLTVEGRLITVSYNGESKQIEVPEATPVVTFAPAGPADLKPGAAVFILAHRAVGGEVIARHVAVGMNGIVPPM